MSDPSEKQLAHLKGWQAARIHYQGSGSVPPYPPGWQKWVSEGCPTADEQKEAASEESAPAVEAQVNAPIGAPSNAELGTAIGQEEDA